MQQQDIAEYASVGELTGGRSFDPPMINEAIMKNILDFMVGQAGVLEFVAGYAPDPASDKPKKHKVEVKLNEKEMGKVLGGTRTVVH